MRVRVRVGVRAGVGRVRLDLGRVRAGVGLGSWLSWGQAMADLSRMSAS